MCGKDVVGVKKGGIGMGSPPRVRERRKLHAVDFGFVGITPACAGKTINNDGLSIFDGDHPRVCGKDLSRQALMQKTSGSPPRVRERH